MDGGAGDAPEAEPPPDEGRYGVIVPSEPQHDGSEEEQGDGEAPGPAPKVRSSLLDFAAVGGRSVGAPQRAVEPIADLAPGCDRGNHPVRRPLGDHDPARPTRAFVARPSLASCPLNARLYVPKPTVPYTCLVVKRGRPREARVDAAVLDAARHELALHGPGGFTMDSVAERAGVGKAAIYRRFPGKSAMIFAAAVHALDIAPPPDHGSLRGDLGALLVDVLRSQDNPLARQAIPFLLQELGRDPAVGQQLEQIFLVRERACIEAVLGRAVARGELRVAPPVHAVHALLMGPVFAWVFVLRRDPTEFVDSLGDAVTAAIMELAFNPAPRRSRSRVGR